MPAGYVEFEFDLPDALLASLIEIFDGTQGAPLVPDNVREIPEEQGVYMLLVREKIEYIGKTDAEAGLRKRLERHAWTIQHRRNLTTSDVSFRAVRVFVFTAMDLEAQLIRHYRRNHPLSWNLSGFGANDPGRNRDRTKQKPEGFDARYPIDTDQELDRKFPRKGSAAEIAAALKRALPYTFRFEGRLGSRQAHPDLETAQITLPKGKLTTRKVIESIIRALPSGWQATLLAGRIIMYRENVDYEFGTVIARK
jgi:Eco29kI restriction endonuclease